MKRILPLSYKDCECHKNNGLVKVEKKDDILKVNATLEVKTFLRMSTKNDSSVLNDTAFIVKLNDLSFCFSANLNMVILNKKSEVVFENLYEKIDRKVEIVENNNKKTVYKLNININLKDFNLNDEIKANFIIFSENHMTSSFEEMEKLF